MTYEEIRTIDKDVYTTFETAYHQLELLEDDRELSDAPL